jgi:hypothetical protein
MTRPSPTLAEIAADFRLWGEYYDVDGHDSPEQWERMTFRDRLEKLHAAFDAEPCRDCGQLDGHHVQCHSFRTWNLSRQ